MHPEQQSSGGVSASLAELQAIYHVELRRLKEDISELFGKIETVQDRITNENGKIYERIAHDIVAVRERINEVDRKISAVDGLDSRVAQQISRDLESLRRELDNRMQSVVAQYKLDCEREFSLGDMKALPSDIDRLEKTITEFIRNQSQDSASFREEQRKAFDELSKEQSRVLGDVNQKIWKLGGTVSVVVGILIWVGKLVFLPGVEDTAKNAVKSVVKTDTVKTVTKPAPDTTRAGQ